MNAKLHPSHLSRQAVIYVRQSSMAQVHGNLESQRRQYGLAERARELGFSQVEVIDEDLGRSASGSTVRPGFERLVALVLSGEVGAVLCIEASRLARNGRDWHHLLDLCALCDTLIIDPDGMYDPRNSGDRLVLGLKGSMSEFELSLLRQRSDEARKQKAARGALQFILPVGFEWTRDGQIVLDPDLRVQEGVRLFFRKVTEIGSVLAVLRWFWQEQVQLPYIKREISSRVKIHWKLPRYSTLLCILKNPLYAGAYAYGKSRSRTRIVEGRAMKSDGERKPIEQWSVLIKDHHPGYIPWSEYVRNQQMLMDHTHQDKAVDRKAGRGGNALLAGMVRCRRCGRRMRVYYHRPNAWQYQCRGDSQLPGSRNCLHLGGYFVDERVSAELLRALSPFAIEAALLAAKRQLQSSQDVVRAVELELEQARYQVELAARRYDEVDPHNRLVASELERRWEEALKRATELEQRLEVVRRPSGNLLEPDVEQLLLLARDLSAVWNAPQADPALKQRLVALLLQEVLCDMDPESNEVVLVLHWQGGRHSELRFPKTTRGNHRRRAPGEVKELLSEHSEKLLLPQLAELLNQRELRTGQGLRWTADRVRAFLIHHRIGKYGTPSSSGPGLTLTAVARRFEISPSSVRSLIARGLLPSGQRAANSTCHISPEALESPEVQAAIEAIQKHGRLSRGQTQTPPRPQQIIREIEGV